jgi:hypothetical protein
LAEAIMNTTLCVDPVMLEIWFAWMLLAAAVHLWVLKIWPTPRHGLRAFTIATLLAPGMAGLEVFTPLPASVATLFWAAQLPGTKIEVFWNAVSWIAAIALFLVLDRIVSRPKIR